VLVATAEAYAYHAERLTKTPELYHPCTREKLLAGGKLTAANYIQGRRDLAQLRLDSRKILAVDVVVTPTSNILARAISEARADDPAPHCINGGHLSHVDREWAGRPPVSSVSSRLSSGIPRQSAGNLPP
jgi:Asp-tRNA(Asn)/Glu-tRNA(Gln) amidotransferase A subunit family amidase